MQKLMHETVANAQSSFIGTLGSSHHIGERSLILLALQKSTCNVHKQNPNDVGSNDISG